MKSEKTCGVGGRPRGFCVDGALDKALQVFWKKGYDGTSLSDLTEAMGINRPSLYAAYGNKEQLFLKVLDRYAETYGGFVREALEKPTVAESVECLLMAGADSLSAGSNPRGCLGVQGALSCSDEAAFVKEEMAKRRAKTQEMILDRLNRGKNEGEIAATADIEALAAFVSTVMQGMSVQSTSGARPEELRQIARVALATFHRVSRAESSP